MEAFKLTERELSPGCCEVQVRGELDLAVADRLQKALDDAIEKYEQVLVSLENCEFIDSTGLAIILRAHTKMSKEGRRFAVYGPSDQVLRTLSITGLTSNGLVFSSAEDALSAPASSE